MLVGWAACLPCSFVVIPLMDTGNPIYYAVAIVTLYAVASIAFGPIAAFIPELFATRYRYTGTALTLNLILGQPLLAQRFPKSMSTAGMNICSVSRTGSQLLHGPYAP